MSATATAITFSISIHKSLCSKSFTFPVFNCSSLRWSTSVWLSTHRCRSPEWAAAQLIALNAAVISARKIFCCTPPPDPCSLYPYQQSRQPSQPVTARCKLVQCKFRLWKHAKHDQSAWIQKLSYCQAVSLKLPKPEIERDCVAPNHSIWSSLGALPLLKEFQMLGPNVVIPAAVLISVQLGVKHSTAGTERVLALRASNLLCVWLVKKVPSLTAKYSRSETVKRWSLDSVTEQSKPSKSS